MLLVNVVGCLYLQVFGAVWNGERCACFDPLCSPVSLLFVPCDPNSGVSKLARLRSVLDKTVGELENYFSSERETNTDRKGPYWTFGDCLKYNPKLMLIDWLYKATLDGKVEVVVKFVWVIMAKLSIFFLLIKVLHPNSSSVAYYLVGGMLW